MDFQQRLIDSLALFSPSKRGSPLKFEPANQILKRFGHETFTQDEGGLSYSWEVKLQCCDIVFGQQVGLVDIAIARYCRRAICDGQPRQMPGLLMT
jgi:hypothetical protein